MDDIVKMGRPHNKGYATPNLSQHNISLNDFHEYNASPDNDWPSVEPPQHVVHAHAESDLNSGRSTDAEL
nr:hypothetical protein [Tanacetum cinerariifolium]